MASVTFSNNSSPNGFTEDSVYSTATLPSGRACSDGTKPLAIVSLAGAVSGNGATRTVQMYCASSSVNLTRAAAGSAAGTGTQNSSDDYHTGGGSVNYGYRSMSGSCYFGRGTSGVAHGAFGDFTGALGMTVNYDQCCTGPTSLSVTPSDDGQSAVVHWGAPSDNGGASVSGYRLQRATNSGFTSGLVTIDASSGVTVTGLTPGQQYWYRATARNAVTDHFSKLGGAWSSTVTATQPLPIENNGKIYSGTVFVDAEMQIWDGTDWDDVSLLEYTSGGWVPVG